MTTRIGIVSDIHAHAEPLKAALSFFNTNDVDLVLCPGDIAGYGNQLQETIELLRTYQCQCVQGNHEAWYLDEHQDEDSDIYRYLKALPRTLKLNIESKHIYMVHAQPPDEMMGGIRLLNQDAELVPQQVQQWGNTLKDFDNDVLIVGHTHQVYAERLSKTLVINPGSTTYNHSCAILNLPALTVEFIALSNQQIKKTWNWGDQFRKK